MAHLSKPSASASVIAAAVVAILAAALTLIISCLCLFSFSLVPLPSSSPEFPPFARILALAMLAVVLCLSVFGIVIGIGLIRLRNWARISIIVWAGAWVFFSFFGVLGIFVLGMVQTSNFPAGSIWTFWLMLAAIYGAPLAIGIWWLILFNRKAIRAQFHTQGIAQAALDLSFQQRQQPRCPVAIVVIAWFYISSAANVLLLPFLRFRIPVLFFGRLIQGTAGLLIFLTLCALFTVLGIGLLKLKRWSYDLTIGLQFLFLTSGIITVFSPSFDYVMSSAIKKMNDAMGLPGDIYSQVDYAKLMRFGMYFGLLVAVFLLVVFFYYRERFLEAAAAKSQVSMQS